MIHQIQCVKLKLFTVLILPDQNIINKVTMGVLVE